jgi:hypothetical protein
LATQRIILAKIAGRAAAAARARFAVWSAARTVQSAEIWSPEQWPDDVRRSADAFADRLRAEGHVLPVVYFSEHVDLWSIGDFYRGCLPAGSNTLTVFGDHFELACYSLPDDNRLADELKEALKQQNVRKNPREEHWFRLRLQEAVRAREPLGAESLLVIVRQVLDVTVTDIEVQQSLFRVPPWIDK